MTHWWRGLGFTMLLLAGCTKANPAVSCTENSCIDPSYPYCDVDGSIAGVPGTCIAVACTAGTFAACAADGTALTCNNSGTGYDEVQCAHGCDSTTGCKLCEANQTVCANGEVATCDASGAQTSTEMCPLGCFEDQPRCRDIDPSNRLGTYLDMVPIPMDLDLSTGSWYVHIADGSISGPTPVSATSFIAPSPSGGPPIRVFVVNNLKLGEVNFSGNYSNEMAVAFVASGDIDVLGVVTVASGVGGSFDASCIGTKGYLGSVSSYCTGTPGAGGGAATAGAPSGYIDTGASGEMGFAGGAAYGTDALEPLVGGCAGGGFYNPVTTENDATGAEGGGAIQLSSRTSIQLSGTIDVDGQPGTGGGEPEACGETVYGGGGGGAILLEAPSVTLAANSKVSAVGGNGGADCSTGNQYCSLGGQGGTASSAAVAGGVVHFNNAAPANTEFWAGGGGGGVGRIRVNTPTGSYTIDSTATENAVVTTGDLETR